MWKALKICNFFKITFKIIFFHISSFTAASEISTRFLLPVFLRKPRTRVIQNLTVIPFTGWLTIIRLLMSFIHNYVKMWSYIHLLATPLKYDSIFNNREFRFGEALLTSRTFFSSNSMTRTIGGAVTFFSLPVKPLKKDWSPQTVSV